MFAQAPSSLADLQSSGNDTIGKLAKPISVEILSDTRGADLQPYIAQPFLRSLSRSGYIRDATSNEPVQSLVYPTCLVNPKGFNGSDT